MWAHFEKLPEWINDEISSSDFIVPFGADAIHGKLEFKSWLEIIKFISLVMLSTLSRRLYFIPHGGHKSTFFWYNYFFSHSIGITSMFRGKSIKFLVEQNVRSKHLMHCNHQTFLHNFRLEMQSQRFGNQQDESEFHSTCSRHTVAPDWWIDKYTRQFFDFSEIFDSRQTRTESLDGDQQWCGQQIQNFLKMTT